MPQRKIWTAEEDKILKLLIEVRGLVKWSQISRVMEEQFKIQGRNGKQCRQRYHNHLAQNIKNEEWCLQEQDILFEMQDEIGNKWALISSSLPGRTDNCVKNHFYSKLRKNLRKINKKINKNLKKQYRDIKTSTLYKIIETLENRNRLGPINETNEQTYELCKKIKNKLRTYEDQIAKCSDTEEQLMHIRSIVENIALFDKEVKRLCKKESLKSSGKLSDYKSISAHNSANLASSTKSIYDDESQLSNQNSEILSQSSYSYPKNQLTPSFITSSMKIFSSQKIESRQTLQPNKCQKGPILYNSANLSNNLMTANKKQKISSQMSDEQGNQEGNMSRQRSSSSSGSQQNYKYLMGEESYMLNITSPPVLTLSAQQIRQINQQNNEWLFSTEMKLDQDQEMIVKDFQKINLSIPNIPKLGMDFF